jgi:hypothetical protein
MHQRYFLIEPKYADPDTFCCFTVGSDRVRASIQIYADLWMIDEVVAALEAPALEKEYPTFGRDTGDDRVFGFELSVLPHTGGNKCLRFRIFQDWLDDGAPYRADIRFEFSPEVAAKFADELKAWSAKPEYVFVWTGD